MDAKDAVVEGEQAPPAAVAAPAAVEAVGAAPSSFPAKHQPAPPRGGFQLFAMEVAPRVSGSWTISDYHNAWAELSEDDRARYNAKGKGDAERYKREFHEWESTGGADWVKRLREVTDRGVLSTKLVGAEMRKVPTACKPDAVRMMATAVEAFIGTLAMESYVHTKTADDKKKVGLVDIHKLIHESDARFGFLAGHFEHPSIFGRSGKKKKSKKAIKAAQLAAQAALAASVSTTSPAKKEKLVKPVHRPKLTFTNVTKLYQARNPDGPAFEKLSQPEKDAWAEQFKQVKDAYTQEEERWKQEYPDEYQGMLKKRDIDRERSRKRKFKEANGMFMESNTTGMSVMIQPGGQSMLAAQQQYLQQQQAAAQQQAMQYQQQMANQMGYPMDQSAMYGAPMMQQKRVIADDPTLRGPWKKVQVVNGFTGSVEEVYFWNTQTNQTSWERPTK